MNKVRTIHCMDDIALRTIIKFDEIDHLSMEATVWSSIIHDNDYFPIVEIYRLNDAVTIILPFPE